MKLSFIFVKVNVHEGLKSSCWRNFRRLGYFHLFSMRIQIWPCLHYAGGIWKGTLHSENPSNIFRPHYARVDTITGYGFVFVNVKKCKCNLFTHGAPRSSQEFVQKFPCIPERIGIWKCWFLRRGENRSTRRKTSRSRVENQQQTQSTHDAESGNRTRATLVGGECSHHCAIPAPRGGNQERENHEQGNHGQGNRGQGNHEQGNHGQGNHRQGNHGQGNHEQGNHEQGNHGQRNHEQGNHGQGNHAIIVKLSFSKSSVHKMFPVHTNMRSGRFQILWIWRARFSKSSVSWRISVDGRSNRRNKAAFSNSSGLVWTLPWRKEVPSARVRSCRRGLQGLNSDTSIYKNGVGWPLWSVFLSDSQ